MASKVMIQAKQELEDHYSVEDPWSYETNPDDNRRRNELLSVLPDARLNRVLDIGCGDGFITFSLSGKEVVGVDRSAKAIEYATKKAEKRSDGVRFRFVEASLFDLTPEQFGQFDLIVITGLLYPQYVGSGAPIVRLIVDRLLRPGGYLASCHIAEWSPLRFSYELIDSINYPYREYTHLLEVLRK